MGLFDQDRTGRVRRDQRLLGTNLKNSLSPINKYGTCFACNGTGEVTAACRTCAGTGTYRGACRVCQGSGVYRGEQRVCRACSSTGWIGDAPCRICDGTGQYQPPEAPCRKCGGSGAFTAPCRRCIGAGSIVSTCAKCEGSGWYKLGLRRTGPRPKVSLALTAWDATDRTVTGAVKWFGTDHSGFTTIMRWMPEGLSWRERIRYTARAFLYALGVILLQIAWIFFLMWLVFG